MWAPFASGCHVRWPTSLPTEIWQPGHLTAPRLARNLYTVQELSCLMQLFLTQAARLPDFVM